MLLLEVQLMISKSPSILFQTQYKWLLMVFPIINPYQYSHTFLRNVLLVIFICYFVTNRRCLAVNVKQYKSQQNFVEFLQTARNQFFLSLFLCNLTQKGVLFVDFDVFVDLRDIFPL